MKKSLVGWTHTDWLLVWQKKSFCGSDKSAYYPTIYSTRKSACDWLRLPDGEYKPVKVKITIEELK